MGPIGTMKLLLLMSLVSSILAQAQPRPFTIGIPQSIDHLNVFTQVSTEFWKIQNYLYESLLYEDATTGELKKNLVKDFKWSKDFLSLEFVLRDDLKWSDGKALTVYDIEHTLNAHKNPENKSMYWGIYEQIIKRVEIKSKDRLIFHFHKKDVSQIRAVGLNLKIYPRHVKKMTNQGPWVSSGPYQVKSFTPGKVVEIVANPLWHGRNHEALKSLYKFDSIRFVSGSSERELFDWLQSGKIDFFQSLSPKVFLELSAKKNSKADWQAVRALGYRLHGSRMVSLNHRHKALKDQSVRKALLQSFDRATVNKKYFSETLEVAAGPWPQAHPLSQQIQFSPVAWNVAAANKTLEAAGWVDADKNGVREKRIDGEVVELKFNFLDHNPENRPLLTLFKEATKKVGIQVDLQLLGFQEMMRRLKDKNFDMVFHQTQWTPHEPNLRYLYLSQDDEKSMLNVGGFKDSQLDSWILAIENATDPSVRGEIYQKCYQRIATEMPDLFWFHDKYLFYFVKNSVQRPQATLPFDLGISTWSF